VGNIYYPKSPAKSTSKKNSPKSTSPIRTSKVDIKAIPSKIKHEG